MKKVNQETFTAHSSSAVSGGEAGSQPVIDYWFITSDSLLEWNLLLQWPQTSDEALSILVMLKVRFRCDCHSVTLAEREVLSQIIRIKLQHLEKKMNREKKTSNSFTQKTYKNTTETFKFIYSKHVHLFIKPPNTPALAETHKDQKLRKTRIKKLPPALRWLNTIMLLMFLQVCEEEEQWRYLSSRHMQGDGDVVPNIKLWILNQLPSFHQVFVTSL